VWLELENWMKASVLLLVILAALVMVLNIQSNTLVTYPSLMSLNQDKNLSSNYPIIPKEAISIANSNVPAFGEVRYGITLINNMQNPYYIVTMYNNNPNGYGKVIAVSRVDAKTGQFLGVSVSNS